VQTRLCVRHLPGPGLNAEQQQSRRDSARLDLLRQELISPILSIEGHAELLREQINDEDCLADLKRIVSAAKLTRKLIDEMLATETQDLDEKKRDSERSRFKHDLRNSVGAISGYSEIILEELEDADDLSEDARTYLDNQLADSTKLLQMLDTLFQAEREFGENSDAEPRPSVAGYWWSTTMIVTVICWRTNCVARVTTSAHPFQAARRWK